MVEAVRSALRDEMARDERVIVLGEDVGRSGGVFRATEGLYEQFGENRLIDMPLAESLIVGTAIGMALNGLRPVAEIQFADFIHPAMDQIINEAARIRYRSGGDWQCPIVIRSPFGAGVRGGLYHSQSVEAFFFHVPGLKVLTPATPYDAKGMLRAAIRDDDPVLVFEHKKAYRHIRGEVPEGDYVVPLGEAAIRREGSDVSVITYGYMVHESLKAAEMLAEQGVSVEVLDLRSLFPLDRESIRRTVGKTNRAVIVYEDNERGGVGAEIAALIADELFEELDGPIVRVAGADVPAAPFAPNLEKAFVVDADRIAAGIRRLVNY